MKLYFADQATAQKWCDEMHAKLIGGNQLYADSVAKGLTKRWHIPTQDTDDAGKVISTDWYTVSDERSDPELTPAEKTQLKPDTFKAAIAAIKPT